MRLCIALMAAVVMAPLVIAGSRPADAICMRQCTDILPSGVCTKYGPCKEVLESVPLKPVRSAKDCPHYRALSCEDSSCNVVCNPNKK